MGSIPKMNFLSQKMSVQFLVIFNRDYIAKNSKIVIILPKNEKFKNLKKSFFGIPEMHLNTKFYLSTSIGVARELRGRKMKNCKMPNFMKISLKIKISKKKYFWTIYNFWLLNSIPKINFLSQKMVVQSLVKFI